MSRFKFQLRLKRQYCRDMRRRRTKNDFWKITLISQQTPSSSSSLVRIPVPDAKEIPTSAKNGAESPNSSRLAVRRLKSAARLLVTRFKMLSTKRRRAWAPRKPRCLPGVEVSPVAPGTRPWDFPMEKQYTYYY